MLISAIGCAGLLIVHVSSVADLDPEFRPSVRMVTSLKFTVEKNNMCFFFDLHQRLPSPSEASSNKTSSSKNPVYFFFPILVGIFRRNAYL